MTKVCKNTKKKTYKGNENTPLGRGYHASVEKIGSKMRGKDKKMYKVIKTKVGKRWQAVTKKPTTKKNRRGGAMSKIITEDLNIAAAGLENPREDETENQETGLVDMNETEVKAGEKTGRAMSKITEDLNIAAAGFSNPAEDETENQETGLVDMNETEVKAGEKTEEETKL